MAQAILRSLSAGARQYAQMRVVRPQALTLRTFGDVEAVGVDLASAMQSVKAAHEKAREDRRSKEAPSAPQDVG